jgi:signal peptidase S26 family
MSDPNATTRSVAGEQQDAAAASASVPQTLASGATFATGTLSNGTLIGMQTVVAPRGTNLTRIQWIIGSVLLVLAGLAIGRLALIDGLPIPGLARVVRIDGPSMAPAFLGGHYRVKCDDCGFVFCCDSEDAPASHLAACPNCGYPENPLRNEDLVAGEQVIVDRWPLLFRAPRPGEVIAAPDPAASTDLVIKRVAAPTGQRLAIRGGDLYADGRLIRKSWRELAKVRVLVHDNNFQPTKTTGVPERWQSAERKTDWHGATQGFHCQAAGGEQFDWLEYQHQQMFGWQSRTRRSPVLDLDSYNPSQTRLLNTVPDVQLSCRLRASGQGRFALAATDSGQRFEAVFDPKARSVVLTAGGREIASKLLPIDFARRSVEIDFGLCDQQVLLRVARRDVFRQAYDRATGQTNVLHPLAIGSQGLSLNVSDLQVWRDAYYLAPDNTGRDWQADPSQDPQGVALLGDNTAVSIDGRNWPLGPKASQIRGIVYRPFWAQ